MTAKSSRFAISVAVLAAALGAAALGTAGCSSVLGFKDPTFNDQTDGNTPPIDAPADVATDMGSTTACDSATCPFGCETGTTTCRAAKLWVYLTIGAFFGDGFGGADMPPDVRAAADALCFTTASQSFATRACTRDRTRAIVTVNSSDSIPTMAALYSIPTTASVNGVSTAVDIHRADDDVLVADNWTALTTNATKTRAPFASATTAPTEPDGVVWTGSGPSGAANCTSWTSKVSTVSGVAGHTAVSDSSVLWLGTGSIACNLLERLACVCWSGGQ